MASLLWGAAGEGGGHEEGPRMISIYFNPDQRDVLLATTTQPRSPGHWGTGMGHSAPPPREQSTSLPTIPALLQGVTPASLSCLTPGL